MRVFLIPNGTFLVRVDGMSGEFVQAMVRVLARSSRTKLPVVDLTSLILREHVSERYGLVFTGRKSGHIYALTVDTKRYQDNRQGF